MKTIISSVAAVLAASLAFSPMASAQESSNRVAAETDWSVFVEDSPKECWGVVPPQKTVNSKNGKPVQVRRSEILLFVTHRPGKPPEVMFMGGYPFAKGSTVELKVNTGQTFNLFTNGEGAWAGSPEDDAKIIAAMKAGADVLVTGRSSRGTKTEDTFSLMGFTAAMEEAAKRCQ
ncbi:MULTISPECIES: invasion associated locus B family protein, partial [Pseudomonadota]|uniref:invasion associated locus B family protein n=1 Tax=Pseudomonadota TaxID=1224 RepID=UPI00190859BA